LIFGFDILIIGLRLKFQDLCDYVLYFDLYMLVWTERCLLLVDIFMEVVVTCIVCVER